MKAHERNCKDFIPKTIVIAAKLELGAPGFATLDRVKKRIFLKVLNVKIISKWRNLFISAVMNNLNRSR
jgi:hypothetical protein